MEGLNLESAGWEGGWGEAAEESRAESVVGWAESGMALSGTGTLFWEEETGGGDPGRGWKMEGRLSEGAKAVRVGVMQKLKQELDV